MKKNNKNKKAKIKYNGKPSKTKKFTMTSRKPTPVYICSPSHSVMSDSLRTHGLYPARVLCPWNSPGKKYWVAIPFYRGSSWPRDWLWIYPDRTVTEKDTCSPMITATLFKIAKTWKQPKCPSTEERIKKMCTYTQWNSTQS